MNSKAAVIKESPSPESMVLIPAGEFQMGNDDKDARNAEQPVHTVHVDAFYMDTHAVTNLDFQRFVLANPKWQKDHPEDSLRTGWYLMHWTGNNYPVGKANHPVTVSWYAAVAYSKWVGKRLPTEAEWEKAARGGLADQKYPWGNTIDSSKANYNHPIGGGTTDVGKYPANGYGLYDMCGNVWEWCLDAYDKNFYFESPARNPLSDARTLANVDLILNGWRNIKSSRVQRGGSWRTSARSVRCAARNFKKPSLTGASGFRCVR